MISHQRSLPFGLSSKSPATSHPKQKHDTLLSLAPDRKREKGEKMTAALDLTSNAGARVRKRKKKKKKRNRLHLHRDSLLEKLGKCRAISLSFSASPSIHPSLSLCLSHQNLLPIRISASLWMGCENTQRTQGVKKMKEEKKQD